MFRLKWRRKEPEEAVDLVDVVSNSVAVEDAGGNLDPDATTSSAEGSQALVQV